MSFSVDESTRAASGFCALSCVLLRLARGRSRALLWSMVARAPRARAGVDASSRRACHGFLLLARCCYVGCYGSANTSLRVTRFSCVL